MSASPDRVLQATAVLLVASLVLIGPSLVGLGASIPLAVLLVAVAVVLFTARGRLAAVSTVGSVPANWYRHVAWLGPAVGAAIVLVSLGASSGELQALGGLCGLVGMVNYFLRPVYGLLLAAVRRLDRLVG